MAIEVPVVAGEGIVIAKKASEEKVEVKLDTDLTDSKYVPKIKNEQQNYKCYVERGFTDGSSQTMTLQATTGDFSNSIIQRDSNGRAKIKTPVDRAEIANKGYVDGGFVAKRTGSDATVYVYGYNNNGDVAVPTSFGVLSDSVVVRDSNGRTKVADPEGQNDAVNKAYVDNRFRYTHFIEVEFNPAPEPYVSYVLIGTITYVSEVSTALTSIDDLPLDVALPIHGKFAEDSTTMHETYTATRKTRSNGTSYLDITYLYYDDASGVAKGHPGEIVPTSFTDTVL